MSTSKGYKWMIKDNICIYVNPNDINKYLNEGWVFGISEEHRKRISKSNIGKTFGKCKDPQKELERKQKISNSLKGNKNWMFNKKHGNSKQGWYCNIHCDSTWELAFLVFYKEHNLNIQRCTEKFEYIWNNEKHIYIPDFITDEGIIEIKGRKTKQSEEKHKQFPNVKVIDENLIKPYLNYVTSKYGDLFWINLYDNYSKDYKDQQYTDKINRKIKKEKDNKLKTQILESACKNSNIDFSKFGWSKKLINYLNENNKLFDKCIFRALKKHYKDFFDIYKPFIRKSANI